MFERRRKNQPMFSKAKHRVTFCHLLQNLIFPLKRIYYRVRRMPLFECQRCRGMFLQQQMDRQQWFCQACAAPIAVDCSECGETYRVYPYSMVHAQVWENLKNKHPKCQFVPRHMLLCQKCDDIPF